MYTQPYIFVIIGISLFIFVVFFALHKLKNRLRLRRSFDFVLLEVSLPDPPASYEAEVPQMRKLFELLSQFKGSFWRSVLAEPEYLGVEIAVIKKVPRMFFVSPRRFSNILKRTIYSVFPDANISEAEDYTAFKEEGEVIVKKIGFKEDEFIPIDFGMGMTMLNFFRILENYSEDETFAFQALFYPYSLKWLTGQRKRVERSKQKIVPRESVEKEEKIAVLNRISEKLSLPCFSVNMRIIFSSKDRETIKRFEEDTKYLFKSESSVFLNSFKLKDGDNKKDIYNYTFRNFDGGEAMILNANELGMVVQLF